MNLDILTCKSCMKIFNTTTRQPQNMSYGHVICLQCYKLHEQQTNTISDAKYQCPIESTCLQSDITTSIDTNILGMLEETEILEKKQLDLSKQQVLMTQGKQPQNQEEKKGYEVNYNTFKVSDGLPNDQGFVINADQINQKSYYSFRKLVDKELQESFLLHKAFGYNFNFEYSLLYKATRDGFAHTDYINNCYEKSSIIIFVLSEYDQTFGGFLQQPLQNKEGYTRDKGAFLFSLTKRQLMFQQQNQSNTYQHHSGYLAAFGRGHDLCLFSNCDQNNSSYSSLGRSFQIPDGLRYKSQEANSYLAGQFKFKVLEIEVYQAKFIQINE
eukprot:403365845